MNRNELLADLLDNIMGYAFYEGHSQGEISSMTMDCVRLGSEEAQKLLAKGKTILIYDMNEGKHETAELTLMKFIEELIKYEDESLPTSLTDFTDDQLKEFNDDVQQFDFLTGAAVLEICFCGEVIYG